MSPFRNQGAKTFKTKLRLKGRKPRTFSCGTTDAATAKAVVGMIKTFKRKRNLGPLEALMDGKVTLYGLYDAYEAGRLDDLMHELLDTDLDPLVTEWNGGGKPKYLMQVRTLIKEGERFPISRFTRKVISEHLAGLQNQRNTKKGGGLKGATRNRYRAAFSSLAVWLIEREVLEVNPARDVRQAKETAREVWYEREDAKRVIAHLTGEDQVREAILAGTGMEWGAVIPLHRRDFNINERKIRAHGSKTEHRNRVVKVTEGWAWDIIWSHIKLLHPDAPLFTPIASKTALVRHKAACKAAGLPTSTLHDWRHTYAVNALRDGIKEAAIAKQLGHKDASMIRKVYGKYAVDDRDYEVQNHLSTNPSTTRRKASAK